MTSLVNTFCTSRIWKILTQTTPPGQSYGIRKELHAENATRKLSDVMMWTHVFFVLGGVLAWVNGLFDLFVINAITTSMSIQYHRWYERPGIVAKFEGVSAKLLFVYGCLQLFQAPPSKAIVVLEYICLCTTVCVFLATNLRKELYDDFHPLMHVVPPLWICLVATFHAPLLSLGR
jgi:hypothetical protein